MRFDVRPTAGEDTGRLPPRPLLQLPTEDILPRLQGLRGPDPHTAGDPHHQQHEDLHHEDLHGGDGTLHNALLRLWPAAIRTLLFPGQDPPVVHVEPLVEIAGDDAGGGDGV